MEKVHKFYQMTIQQRQEIMDLMMQTDQPFNQIELAPKFGEKMIENYVGNYPLPLGLAVNFDIDGEIYHIPMATEEPSVIAAACNGAKRVGTITTSAQSRELIGQIVIDTSEVSNSRRVEIESIIQKNEQYLLNKAKELSFSMIQRGGGPTRLFIEKFDQFITVYLGFNPCDAMGANSINHILEMLAHDIEFKIEVPVLMSILSNYQTHNLSTATCQIPIQTLHSNQEEAQNIAKKIVVASQYAQLDVYRATTHNKGILNGIAAVLIATGNDFRAVEAGVHAFAARSGKYQGLSQWKIEDGNIVGELTLPLAVATVGGTLSSHPVAQWTLKVLKSPTAQQLSRILVAVGLAQNFAAIRALVTEGIQKGHMSLHARQLCLQAGAKEEEIPLIIQQIPKNIKINQAVIAEILKQIRNYK